MQWTEFVAELGRYCQQEVPDASFSAATPNFANVAELRIYRDLPFLATYGDNTSLQTVALAATIDLTAMSGQEVGGRPVAYQYPVVVDKIEAKVGNRWVPFQKVSPYWRDMTWPDDTVVAVPRAGLACFAPIDDQTVKIAPVPDRVYPLRVSGTWRPAPMSASNPQTWLGDNLPDLFFAAAMVEAMGYQRAFGAQADDPRTAVSWEAMYQTRLKSARDDEGRRLGLAQMPAPRAGATA